MQPTSPSVFENHFHNLSYGVTLDIPFRNRSAQAQIVVERNDDYWGGAIHYPKRMVFQILQEPYVAAQLLKKGEIDVFDGVSPIIWKYDLEQSVVRAPGPGSVPQQTLRPGMMALPLRPVMTFVHADEQYFIAAFEQNSLQRIRPGDEAEIAFDALPGQIVKGRVRSIIDAMAPGQIQPGGSLIDPSTITGSGRTLAVIDITDDVSAYNLPGGAEAQVALYTEYWHHFALIRRILLRMKSWQNYVFLEGH